MGDAPQRVAMTNLSRSGMPGGCGMFDVTVRGNALRRVPEGELSPAWLERDHE